MRQKVIFIGTLLFACLLLAGCSTKPTTFTINGTWQFPSTEQDPIFGGPCTYPPGAITVSDAYGKVLGKAAVTDTDFGDVGGYAVCNVQFAIKHVPLSVHRFKFAVPYDQDSKIYARDDLEYLEIKSSQPSS